MNFSEIITESINSKDLTKFTELANHPALLINDIFDDGLLHYLLLNYPQYPLEFFKVVLDNVDTDVNKISKNKLPPILSTERTDLQDTLLALDNINVNIIIDNARLINVVLRVGDMELFKKLVKHPRMDLIQSTIAPNEDMTLLNYSMKNNMEAFKILLLEGDRLDLKRIGILDYAIKTNNLEAFTLLLEKGANFNMEYLMEMGASSMLELVLNKYFHMIPNKDKLFEKGILLENVMVINKFLEKGYPITDELLIIIVTKKELVKLVISKIDTITIDESLLVKSIFDSEDTELIELVRIDNIREYVLRYLIECNNSSLVVKIINANIEYLRSNNLIERLLIEDEGHMFNVLSNGGEEEFLEMLIDTPDLKIPPTFKPVATLVIKEQYNLFSKMMFKFDVYLSNFEHYSLLVNNGDPDILMMALETCSKMNIKILNDYSFVIRFYKLLSPKFALDMLESPLINKKLFSSNVLTQLLTIPGFMDMFENKLGMYIDMNYYPPYILDLLFSIQDGYIIYQLPPKFIKNIPIIKFLYKGEYIIRQATELIQHIIQSNSKYLKYLIYCVLTLGDRDVFDIFYRIVIDLDRPNIDIDLIEYLGRSEFVIHNIDAIFNLFPEISLSSIMAFTLATEEYPELLISSNVVPKILRLANYDPNSMITETRNSRYEDSDEDNATTQLSSFVFTVDKSQNTIKTPTLDAKIYVIKKYLELPSVNVNEADIRNNDYDYTLLELLILEIDEFNVDIDYSSEEHYSFYCQVIKILLADSRIDLSQHRKLLHVISGPDVNLENLLTIILSHPTMDFNTNYTLHSTCTNKDVQTLGLLLTFGQINVNLKMANGDTPLHICIKNNFTEGAILLLEDPRIDLTIVDNNGRNYARLANKASMTRVVELLAGRGQLDDKKIRVDRQIAEYDAKMAAMGRVKQTRIRETLNSFDLILKEPVNDKKHNEDNDGNFIGSITPYNKSMCPFCLTYIEKENGYECVYLAGHRCPVELENEPLKRLYFGDEWATKYFEICCICGRPAEHHGHFKHTIEGEPQSNLLPNKEFANHWDCDHNNGGGGRKEMICRLVGILTELKHRVDSEEHLVYGPELIRELAMVANNSVRDEAIKKRVFEIFLQSSEKLKWNANSKIEKYVKFNAPVSNASNSSNASNKARETREPIIYYDNTVNDEDNKQQCMICLDEADNLFKPHESDQGYICNECIKRQVCASRYASVTCELGCRPKKQIHKEDVNALMGGNFCDGVEVGEEDANENN